jgi:hypothetical protein
LPAPGLDRGGAPPGQQSPKVKAFEDVNRFAVAIVVGHLLDVGGGEFFDVGGAGDGEPPLQFDFCTLGNVGIVAGEGVKGVVGIVEDEC